MEVDVKTIIIIALLIGLGAMAYKSHMLNFSAFNGSTTSTPVKLTGLVNYYTNLTPADGTIYIRKAGSTSFETVQLSSGSFETSLEYAMGSNIELQIHAQGCYTAEYSVVVPTVPDTRSSASIGSFQVYPIGNASMYISDQNGDKLSSSNSYNYTTYGTTLKLTISITVSDDGTIGLPHGYTDWSTGDTYHTGFVAIKIGSSDAADFVPETYNDQKSIGDNMYYIYNIDSIINKASVATDGTYSFAITVQINGPATFHVMYFDMVENSDYAVMNLPSPDASVLNVQVVA